MSCNSIPIYISDSESVESISPTSPHRQRRPRRIQPPYIRYEDNFFERERQTLDTLTRINRDFTSLLIRLNILVDGYRRMCKSFFFEFIIFFEFINFNKFSLLFRFDCLRSRFGNGPTQRRILFLHVFFQLLS